ncbi:Rrf2 family transcriptional regulator [Aquimarina algiphila]|uniref:Rrf2 family transcriptional regulator n=1 Tax=Aquimarina algiphila TaxID=2047982 RepID=UPI0031F10D3D
MQLQKHSYLCTVTIFNTVILVKSKFSISLHIMTLLALYKDDWCSSSDIASSLNINPVLVRKEIAALKKGHLIESKEGKNGGIRLLKDANKIYLSDIFTVIKGDSSVLSLSNNIPDPTCRIGKQINTKLETLLETIDNSIVRELNKQTLEEFKNQF